jgi:8-oxo-dGTP pyrophosphatase MutT (NUDIX family)
MNIEIDKMMLARVEGRKLLFARTRGLDTFYSLGGKREPGETDEAALIREVWEEANVHIKPATIRHIHTFEGPAPDGRWMRMTCYDADFDGVMTPSSEIEEFKYLGSEDKHLTTQMGAMLLDWFKEQDLID